MASLFGVLTGPNYFSSAKLEKHFLDTSLYNKTETKIEKKRWAGAATARAIEAKAWERDWQARRLWSQERLLGAWVTWR